MSCKIASSDDSSGYLSASKQYQIKEKRQTLKMTISVPKLQSLALVPIFAILIARIRAKITRHSRLRPALPWPNDKLLAAIVAVVCRLVSPRVPSICAHRVELRHAVLEGSHCPGEQELSTATLYLLPRAPV
jgi:hypothetical protein